MSLKPKLFKQGKLIMIRAIPKKGTIKAIKTLNCKISSRFNLFLDRAHLKEKDALHGRRVTIFEQDI